MSIFSSKPKIPTDLEILECIYVQYYHEFASYKKGERAAKVYVPIDFDLIGKKLGIDGDIPFGRLYYYLNAKYRVDRAEGAVQLFELGIGTDSNRSVNAVQFPFLASVLAELRAEQRRFSVNITIAWISLAVSLLAIIVSVFRR